MQQYQLLHASFVDHICVQGFQLGFTHFPRERIKAIKETCAKTKGWIRRLGEGTVQPVCMWGQQGSYRGKLGLEMYIDID